MLLGISYILWQIADSLHIMEDARKLVEAKIAGKKVMIFSKSFCSYCAKAKKVFKIYLGKELSEEDYEVLEIDNRKDCAALQDFLLQKTGGRSVSKSRFNIFYQQNADISNESCQVQNGRQNMPLNQLKVGHLASVPCQCCHMGHVLDTVVVSYLKQQNVMKNKLFILFFVWVHIWYGLFF